MLGEYSGLKAVHASPVALGTRRARQVAMRRGWGWTEGGGTMEAVLTGGLESAGGENGCGHGERDAGEGDDVDGMVCERR